MNNVVVRNQRHCGGSHQASEHEAIKMLKGWQVSQTNGHKFWSVLIYLMVYIHQITSLSGAPVTECVVVSH